MPRVESMDGRALVDAEHRGETGAATALGFGLRRARLMLVRLPRVGTDARTARNRTSSSSREARPQPPPHDVVRPEGAEGRARLLLAGQGSRRQPPRRRASTISDLRCDRRAPVRGHRPPAGAFATGPSRDLVPMQDPVPRCRQSAFLPHRVRHPRRPRVIRRKDLSWNGKSLPENRSLERLP